MPSDLWHAFAGEVEEGDLVEGTVAELVPFGAFVVVAEGVEGLVHISEISPDPVDHPQDRLAQGQRVITRILEVDRQRGRLLLSIKQAGPGFGDPAAGVREPRNPPPDTGAMGAQGREPPQS